MRKVLAAAALAGSFALTGLAVAPAAQAATSATSATQATSSMGNWGKYYSSNKKAYTYGKTWSKGGKVYTHWYGKEFTPKKGYVWFRYTFKNGGSGKHFYAWNGSYHHQWSLKGIKKLYTYTCWGGKFKYCGGQHRIY
ncbi:hypothetical protein SAMN05444920_113289 [Nonomuraea solani]|uniref:Bacteriocin (Lactococcin_972) n=1 Tax=Nonomuraea solani TaxID=1144553 RepID=A0A1H6EQK8_9ACTN|nr:hypothetical protein [Nonomuraea solani]SEG99693.1 hypothetical protein SAMN05444920_113289 [Nonomuraea solani]